MNRWQAVFSRKASPLMRWLLGPFLLFYAAFMIIPLQKAMEEGRTVGVVVCLIMMLVCVAGFLATWGVPLVGRICSGFIALLYVWYVADQWIINFDGDLGAGERRSATNPINAVLGFFFWGLPCAIYTIFGRFSWRKEEGWEGDDFTDEYEDDEEHDPPGE